jgi:protein-S-isoprenylcysteine O-methyltransferase Ste14
MPSNASLSSAGSSIFGGMFKVSESPPSEQPERVIAVMNRKDFTPAVLSILLLLGIVLFAAARYWRMPSFWVEFPVNLDAVFIALYILWLLVEAPIAGRDINTETAGNSDGGTCQIYAVSQALTVLSALWFPAVWHAPNAAHFVGIGLFLCGVCYRLWAIRTLGVFYSHRVRTVNRYRVVDSGPYRFTRHPAYAGMVVANIGVALYFSNRKKRKRLFPAIW